ncbi:hypothetical protein WN48_00224 [Eufriesea mexicana]|uniref:Uncharacterized protein n=1 Tax=Eufriesea mexicana TaxID=516756 RepID=A0A310S8V6_9HYME|nr:hypothetical protein WN48_00224 [Eufriesea mexicana]
MYFNTDSLFGITKKQGKSESNENEKKEGKKGGKTLRKLEESEPWWAGSTWSGETGVEGKKGPRCYMGSLEEEQVVSRVDNEWPRFNANTKPSRRMAWQMVQVESIKIHYGPLLANDYSSEISKTTSRSQFPGEPKPRESFA